MKTELISYDTSKRWFVDLTADLEEFASGCAGDGLVHVFVPHATAGVAVMESGSGSEQDLADALERLLPRQDVYRHRHGSPAHGRDHVVPAFVSPSVVLPIVNGTIALGTWQSVLLVDTNRDNSHRQVRFSFLPG